MQQTLDQLGQPDRVHSYPGGALFGDEFYLSFVYLQSRLRIVFGYNPYALRRGCNLQTIEDDMVVDTLTYYSVEAAQELLVYPGNDDPQEVLTALHLGENLVSLDVWQEVMNNGHEEFCSFIPYERNNPITAPIVYAELDTPRSLFAEDTCAPPCWFSLTPGESTSEDVAAFIQDSDISFREWRVHPDSIFNEETGLILSGSYHSRWVFFEREYPVDSGTALVIDDGILIRVTSNINHTVLLHEVLSQLGTPDYIVIDWSDVARASLNIGYFDLRLHIYFRSIRSGCNVGRMSNNFWVDRVEYYAPMSERQAQRNIGLGYGMTEVPIETW